jgi:hypothetical protein
VWLSAYSDCGFDPTLVERDHGSQSEVAALEARGYFSDEERDDGAAIKKAIEAVLSDIELDVQSETAERSRARG